MTHPPFAGALDDVHYTALVGTPNQGTKKPRRPGWDDGAWYRCVRRYFAASVRPDCSRASYEATAFWKAARSLSGSLRRVVPW